MELLVMCYVLIPFRNAVLQESQVKLNVLERIYNDNSLDYGKWSRALIEPPLLYIILRLTKYRMAGP